MTLLFNEEQTKKKMIKKKNRVRPKHPAVLRRVTTDFPQVSRHAICIAVPFNALAPSSCYKTTTLSLHPTANPSSCRREAAASPTDAQHTSLPLGEARKPVETRGICSCALVLLSLSSTSSSKCDSPTVLSDSAGGGGGGGGGGGRGGGGRGGGAL